MILAGDVGGTKTLLALFPAHGGPPLHEAHYRSAAFDGLEPMLEAFLAGAPGAAPRSACFGAAGSVAGSRVRLTNLPWAVDAQALTSRFGIAHVVLLNDFEAAVHGLGALGEGDRIVIQAGAPDPGAPCVVIGAGTGLGIAFGVPVADGLRAVAGEGGHAGFAPRDALQDALVGHLRTELGRVTNEHLLSGPGLVRIHGFLSARRGALAMPQIDPAQGDAAAAVVRNALERGDACARDAVDLFLRCYAQVAGDHALAVGARGGVFLGGGIAPRIASRIAAAGFTDAFNDKAPFRDAMRRVPVSVVANPALTLLGAAAVARQALTG